MSRVHSLIRLLWQFYANRRAANNKSIIAARKRRGTQRKIEIHCADDRKNHAVAYNRRISLLTLLKPEYAICKSGCIIAPMNLWPLIRPGQTDSRF